MKLLIRCNSRHTAVAGAVVWALAVGIGFLALCTYEATPGPTGPAAEHWPAAGRLALASDRHTLIMAVHPRCPCTRASSRELARILARCPGRVTVYLLIFTPAGAGGAWGHADWSRNLASIPGVHSIHDPGGDEAARFGAQTSGQVALYASDGRLLFRGGITAARGHEGGNRGEDTLVALLGGGSHRLAEYPVFGCPIFDPSRSPSMRDSTCTD